MGNSHSKNNSFFHIGKITQQSDSALLRMRFPCYVTWAKIVFGAKIGLRKRNVNKQHGQVIIYSNRPVAGGLWKSFDGVPSLITQVRLASVHSRGHLSEAKFNGSKGVCRGGCLRQGPGPANRQAGRLLDE